MPPAPKITNTITDDETNFQKVCYINELDCYVYSIIFHFG